MDIKPGKDTNIYTFTRESGEEITVTITDEYQDFLTDEGQIFNRDTIRKDCNIKGLSETELAQVDEAMDAFSEEPRSPAEAAAELCRLLETIVRQI